MEFPVALSRSVMIHHHHHHAPVALTFSSARRDCCDTTGLDCCETTVCVLEISLLFFFCFLRCFVRITGVTGVRLLRCCAPETRSWRSRCLKHPTWLSCDCLRERRFQYPVCRPTTPPPLSHHTNTNTNSNTTPHRAARLRQGGDREAGGEGRLDLLPRPG